MKKGVKKKTPIKKKTNSIKKNTVIKNVKTTPVKNKKIIKKKQAIINIKAKEEDKIFLMFATTIFIIYGFYGWLMVLTKTKVSLLIGIMLLASFLINLILLLHMNNQFSILKNKIINIKLFKKLFKRLHS